MPTLGPIRQNAGCHQLTRSGDWLFLNSHKVKGIKRSPGSHRKSRMSASPFSLEDGSLTFSKRKGHGYLSALNGKHKVICKVRRSPTTWRCSCNFIRRSVGNSFEGWKTRQSLKMTGDLAEERQQEVWQERVLSLNLSPSVCWFCDFRLIT